MRRWILRTAALALLIVASPAAFAQTTQADKAAARALFDEGRKLASSGKHADACPKFEESQRLDPGVGTMFNLADCYEAMGKTASAWSMFLEAAARLKSEGAPAEKEQAARQRAAALEPRLSRLKIVVPDGAVVPGLLVSRDGSETKKGSWGTAIPVDPGQHVIEASAPGKKPWRQAIDVAKDGANASVTIPVLEEGKGTAPVAPAARADRAQPKKTEDKKGLHARDGLFLTLRVGGGGVTDKLKYQGVIPADGQATGGSGAFEIAGGWGLKPGIILGLAVHIEQVANPKVTLGGIQVDQKIGTLGLIGPTALWFFKPEGGLHVAATFGAANISVNDKSDNTRDNTATGAGGSVGIGYDFWVGDKWTVGGMGRFLAARLNDSSANMNHTWTSGAILLTGTYN
ncbi:MAG: hypothetical protein HY898_28840 [Deltaproteobacteria bacterium]|nr:hypothetical protein [Deltaproteobacteria bacterium]